LARSARVRIVVMTIIASAASTALFTGLGIAIAKPAAAIAPATGTWGVAREILGTTSLNQGGLIESTGLSCGSPGNCVVGGSERTRTRHLAPFVASEVSGT
jgi:hypothetical protein